MKYIVVIVQVLKCSYFVVRVRGILQFHNGIFLFPLTLKSRVNTHTLRIRVCVSQQLRICKCNWETPKGINDKLGESYKERSLNPRLKNHCGTHM